MFWRGLIINTKFVKYFLGIGFLDGGDDIGVIFRGVIYCPTYLDYLVSSVRKQCDCFFQVGVPSGKLA